MDWTERSSGHFARPFDPTDLFMATVCSVSLSQGREHWVVNASARLSKELDGRTRLDRLQRAWANVRYQHPLIAATMEGAEFHYQSPDDEDLKKWLADTVHVETISLDELMAVGQVTAQSSLHYLVPTQEIVVRIQHSIVDGMGALAFLNQFLVHLSGAHSMPEFGSEHVNLAPTLTVASGFPTRRTRRAQDSADEIFSEFANHLPSIGLPYEQAQKIGAAKQAKHSLSESQTIALLSACKTRGIGVASAVHAAMVVATQEMKTDFAGAKSYVSVGSFNYRPFLEAPYNDASRWPLGVYMLGIPISRPEADFDAHARAFHKFYRQVLHRDETAVSEGYNLYLEKMMSALSQPPPKDFPPPTQPQLSSLGLLDKRIQTQYSGPLSLQVDQVGLAVDQMTPGLVIYQWTWQGCLSLSACFNAAYHSTDMVQAYLCRTAEVLLHSLQIG